MGRYRPRNSLVVSLMPPQSEPHLPQMNVAILGLLPHSLKTGMDGESVGTMAAV